MTIESTQQETPSHSEAQVTTPKLPNFMLIRSVSLTGIFVILVLFSLHAAADILIPITIAYSLSLLLSPLIRRLSQWRIPPPLSAAFVVMCFLTAALFAIYSLFEPAEEWVDRAPQIVKEIKHKISPMLGSIEGAQKAAEDVDKLIDNQTNDRPSNQPTISVSVEPQQSRIERMLSNTSSALSSIGIVVVLLYFLLAAGDTFLNKLVSITPKFEDKRKAVEIIREVQRDTSRYLTVRTLINIGLGMVVTFAMYLLDMPNPWLWGALAAVLNFAPYVGPAISLTLITIAAVISLDTLAQALVVPLVVLLINIIEGEFISHQLIGKRLSLSPVVVFISIVFWGWLWGIAGALMAIPIIAAINVVCQHVDSLKPLSEFIRDSEPR
ncbi:AI-2E family transporter [Arenicella xantha]|uniref:Putative PurR-regulated permease PerM n=1 Tax=Arenicella xantha TaxID=644221 RepID=A0A395JQ78_9GAMM|nr:AI-2E family transporter [Arenicella xantha]RBP52775.1 putative PurR-regulated permease PerM [Arenicella xantha]